MGFGKKKDEVKKQEVQEEKEQPRLKPSLWNEKGGINHPATKIKE